MTAPHSVDYGGERPEGKENRRGTQELSGLAGGAGGEASNPFSLNEFCWLLVTWPSKPSLGGGGKEEGMVSSGTDWDHGML